MKRCNRHHRHLQRRGKQYLILTNQLTIINYTSIADLQEKENIMTHE